MIQDQTWDILGKKGENVLDFRTGNGSQQNKILGKQMSISGKGCRGSHVIKANPRFTQNNKAKKIFKYRQDILLKNYLS